MALALDSPQLSTRWIDDTGRRRLVVLTTAVALTSLGLARLILSYGLPVVAGLAVVLTLAAIFIRPRLGVYFLLAVVLLFDGVGEDPLMLPGVYLDRSLQETIHLSGAIFIPIELLLLLTVAVWLAHAAMHQRLNFQPGAFGRPVLLFGVALTYGVVRGLLSGATVNYAFWESRFLFGMVLTYVLVTNLIRKREHVRILTTLVIVCVGLAGVEGIWRRFALADAGVLGATPENWYSHEDVVIWGMLIMLVAAQQAFGAPRWQRILGPPLLLCTSFTMLISERRAGYIAVIVAFLAFSFMLLAVNRKAFLLLAVPAFIAGAVYLPVFWNNTGTFGQPARAIRSLSAPDPRDAASNAWRDLEAINVRATIASDPLLGIGFGRPFLQIVTVPSISFFEFWNYESHHDILWLWMKTGALGFVSFFVLVTLGVARSVWLVRTLHDPELRTFAVVASSAILMSVTFCYVDLGLTSARIPIVLGIALGTLGVLDRLRTAQPRPG